MHLKRYFKMCNLFALTLVLMMGNGGGGSKRKIQDRQENLGIGIGISGEGERRRRGMTVPKNGDVPPPVTNSTSFLTVISAKAPFPLPTTDMELYIKSEPDNSGKRKNTKAKVLVEIKK